MADYFCDSSALVKRHAEEVGTAWMQGICAPAAGNEVWAARVTGAEVVSAFWRKVRGGTMSTANATKVTRAFKDHFRNQYRVVEVRAATIEEAMDLAQQHGLRGYDAVQLASAKSVDADLQSMGLPPLIFVSADDDLIVAAQKEGLATENPNSHA
ncbi:MAG: type II toxin-antitoxin system VapC family toxin [Planctomycetes bacterium]|nr:type II toxin-antitoxin system VapC family toxin [Planctomycetota bacterium]